jgi:hypothetical protein
LATIAKFADDANLKPGQFLLIADKKVPESLAPMREKIFELVDGKTQCSLFLEFKQCEEEEEERITELTLATDDTSKWLIENADAKNLGSLDSRILLKLQTACQTASGFITRLLDSRKANGGAQ